MAASYSTVEHFTQEEIEANVQDAVDDITFLCQFVLFCSPEQLAQHIAAIEAQVRAQTTYEEEHEALWPHDGKGRFSRETNPCVNGSLDDLDLAQPCRIGGFEDTVNGEQVSHFVDSTAERKKGHGWVPVASVTVDLTDTSRAYFRYSEALRFPGLFENTIGSLTSQNPHADLGPERAYHYELAYIHGFPKGDIKFSYYHHRTEDVIERSRTLWLVNIEKQTIRGLEFQGRYDNGRLFTDLGIAYNLENEICDQSYAILADSNFGSVPDCVQGGFIGGYLINRTSPDYAVNWALGGRFMDDRLELGGRVTYYAAYDNPDLEEYAANVDDNQLAWFNAPRYWDSISLYDAYASYRVTDNVLVEAIGTNLTNRYYIDPVARSPVPGPGRTLKLSLTVNF